MTSSVKLSVAYARLPSFFILFCWCYYAECLYAECRYAECHYAECHGALGLALMNINPAFVG